MSKTEYMVSVDGKSAPCKVHTERQEAFQEATRLSQMPNNRGATIRVLEVISVLEPTHQWRERAAQPKAPWYESVDPCPNCVPGGACRTPSCGRLKMAQANGQP